MIFKFNYYFFYVVVVMISNNVLLCSRVFNLIKYLFYCDYVNDLWFFWLLKFMVYGGGIMVEFLVFGILVFVVDGYLWWWFFIGFMVFFYFNILFNFLMGVLLEWNVFFIFLLCYLFGYYGVIIVIDFWLLLLLVIVIVVVVVVIMGNLLFEKILFLFVMCYYVGNWVISIWCF